MSAFRTKIYLVGSMKNQILRSKLHSKSDVLNVLFFNMRTVGLNLYDSASLVIDEALIFWKKARIPTQNRSNCITKVKKLYGDLRNLEKSKGRSSSAHKQKENQLNENLCNLFDIAIADALNVIKIAEDKEFLLLQR